MIPTISSNNHLGQPPSISCLPDELLLKIFGDLSPKDLGRASSVSTRWQRLASDHFLWKAFDLKEIFPSLKIISEMDWKNHTKFVNLELPLDDALPLENHIVIPILTRLFSSLQIEKEAGITLLTIPKGLTINKLNILLEHPDSYGPDFLDEFEDAPVEKTYTVAITNAILTGSEKLSRQQEFIKENGCEMPKILEAAALFAFLDQEPSCLSLYTHCQQVNIDNCVVGPVADLLIMNHNVSRIFFTKRCCFIKEKQPSIEQQNDLISSFGSFGVLKV